MKTDHLQLAFHSYAFGNMVEQHLFSIFEMDSKQKSLLDKYLQMRPEDYLSVFFQNCVKVLF